MIKHYEGQRAEKMVTSKALPAGGYVAKIINARIDEYSWGAVVVIAFDIAEGEYKDFFQAQYAANTYEKRKWKGTYRLTIPDEGSRYFESNQRTFNNFIYAIEDSNDGYHYDSDEKNFKDKMIGVIFRNSEWEMDGRTGWTTECGAITDVTSIRENSFKPLGDKPLKNTAVNNQQTAQGYVDIANIDDEDLPF